MKKILTLISIMMFAFVLIGCGGSKPENPEDPGTQPEEPSETPEEGLDSIEKVIELFKIDEVAKIEIQANDAITSKKDYVNAKIIISGEDYTLEETDVRIRLRGNSSLSAPKKSYKLKFNEKEDIFNFGKDKEWALTANYFDTSLMRNYYAYKLAQAMGIQYSVDCKYVELWLNGNNQGLYLFTETVKTGSQRVDIEVDYTKEDQEIPFLLELDMNMSSEESLESNGVIDVDYFDVNIQHYRFDRYSFGTKYPDDFTEENITKTQYEYIKNYIFGMYDSLENNTFEEYIDIDSAINFYMLQEIMMNIDIDYSSVFMYKPVNEKLKFGPVWDFDISSGNCNYTIHPYGPNTLMKDVNEGSRIINKLLEYNNVKEKYLNRLEEIGEFIIPGMEQSFDINYEILKDYAKTDNSIWKNLNKNYWPKPSYLVNITYKEQVDYLKNYLVKHYNYMLKNM